MCRLPLPVGALGSVVYTPTVRPTVFTDHSCPDGTSDRRNVQDPSGRHGKTDSLYITQRDWVGGIKFNDYVVLGHSCFPQVRTLETVVTGVPGP